MLYYVLLHVGSSIIKPSGRREDKIQTKSKMTLIGKNFVLQEG